LDKRRELDAFLAEHERRAYRMAHISTGCKDEALDVVQDAMIAFVQKYADKDEADWRPLFFRVLRSKIVDLHRRRKVRSAVMRFFTRDEEGKDIELEVTASPAGNPEQLLKAQSALVALEAALQALPVKQQQTVMLRAWEGLDTRDTAIAMGVSQGSVKTHYSRGMAKLKRVLGEYWP